MVGSRAFACVLHRGPDGSAVLARTKKPSGVAASAAVRAAFVQRATAIKARAPAPAAAAAVPVSGNVSGHVAAASLGAMSGVLTPDAAPADAPRVDHAAVGDTAVDGAAVPGGPPEAPRRLRALRLGATRPARLRVAQRLGNTPSRNPSPARNKPRRDAHQLPSHLRNLARRDLAASGFTGFLPVADAIEDTPAEPEQSVDANATLPALVEPALSLAPVTDSLEQRLLEAAVSLGVDAVEEPAPVAAPALPTELCGSCSRTFEVDWLACPDCGELPKAARAITLPSPRPRAANEIEAGRARVVRPAVAPPRQAERDSSAMWTYLVGAVVIALVVLFLIGAF